MQLRRIEVRDFRKLTHRRIEGLSDGLNVIVGDNEAGKSTLLAALRAVLFERHRVGGKVLAAMLPHGAEVRPEIAIDFSLDGGAYSLRKAFNQRPEASLTLPDGRTLTGDAVEERMAALLGFQAPGNRGSKPEEHQGVYGLLWVEQASAHAPINAGAGQDLLSSALEREVGQVVGGERGRHLLALAEQRRDALWDKRGKPKGAYRQALDRVTALEGQREALDARLRRYDEQVAALSAKTEILARYRRDDRLAAAGRAVAAAQVQADRAAQLDATLTDLRRAHAGAVLARDAAAERLRDRQALAGKALAADEAARRIESERADAAAALDRAQAASRQALDARRSATHAVAAIAERIDALDRHRARRDAAQRLAGATAALEAAEAVAAKRRAARDAAARIAVTKTDVAALDRLAAARDQARSRRDAASVQITFEAAAAASVTIDGAPHAPDAPVLLARDAVLDLSGFGRLRIRPGGGAEALARSLDEAETALAAALRQLRLPSREAAAAALAEKAEAEAEAAAQTQLLAVLTPSGLDPLRLAADSLRTAVVEGLDEPEPPDEDHAALRQQRDAARLAADEADAELGRADAVREDAARHLAVLSERAVAARRGHQDLSHALTTARTSQPDDRLTGTLAEAERAAALAAEAEAVAATALAAADPETAQLGLRRAREAETAIRADIETLTRERRDLDIELRTLGQDGFGEQLAEVEGQLVAAREQRAARALEAEASLLLHDTLAAAQRETRDRWLGPVRDRVRPYLRLIHPGSEIVLNEKTFSIEHLLRDGVSEPFETLSVGAREQIAVITRLALADVLRASGQPSAIILDDALVNTDEGRLESMHLVLQRAAEHLQVLVLTCRERDFLSLGAPIHRL